MAIAPTIQPSKQQAASPGPGIHHVAVTPVDGANLPFLARALWVGVLGNVSVTDNYGVTCVYVGVQGLLPFAAACVNATNTTATNIIAMD